MCGVCCAEYLRFDRDVEKYEHVAGMAHVPLSFRCGNLCIAFWAMILDLALFAVFFATALILLPLAICFERPAVMVNRILMRYGHCVRLTACWMPYYCADFWCCGCWSGMDGDAYNEYCDMQEKTYKHACCGVWRPWEGTERYGDECYCRCSGCFLWEKQQPGAIDDVNYDPELLQTRQNMNTSLLAVGNEHQPNGVPHDHHDGNSSGGPQRHSIRRVSQRHGDSASLHDSHNNSSMATAPSRAVVPSPSNTASPTAGRGPPTVMVPTQPVGVTGVHSPTVAGLRSPMSERLRDPEAKMDEMRLSATPTHEDESAPVLAMIHDDPSQHTV